MSDFPFYGVSSASNTPYNGTFVYGYDPFGELKRQIPSTSTSIFGGSNTNGTGLLGSLPAAPKAQPSVTSNANLLAAYTSALMLKNLNLDKTTATGGDGTTGKKTTATKEMDALEAANILMNYFDKYQTQNAEDGTKLASWDDLQKYVEENPDDKELAAAVKFFENNQTEFNKMEVIDDDDKKVDEIFTKNELQKYIEDLEAEAEDDDE